MIDEKLLGKEFYERLDGNRRTLIVGECGSWHEMTVDLLLKQIGFPEQDSEVAKRRGLVLLGRFSLSDWGRGVVTPIRSLSAEKSERTRQRAREIYREIKAEVGSDVPDGFEFLPIDMTVGELDLLGHATHIAFREIEGIDLPLILDHAFDALTQDVDEALRRFYKRQPYRQIVIENPRVVESLGVTPDIVISWNDAEGRWEANAGGQGTYLVR